MTEPVCTCTELEQLTVCHDTRNEPHLVGCPRWGTPREVRASYPCDRCDGMQELYVHQRISAHAYTTSYATCPSCNGTGRREE